MPDNGLRQRGHARTRTLLLGGGAAAVITAAIALSSIGTANPNGQHGSTPQAGDARPAVAGHDAAASALPRRKPGVSSALPAPVSLALSHRTTDREENTGNAKKRNTATNRPHIPEPHHHRETLHSAPAAGPTTGRRSPHPSNQARRPADDPRPPSWDLSRWGISPSMIATKCDELFPPRKRENRLRNIACHHLFN